MIAALALALISPVQQPAEQAWARCSYQRLETRLRYEDEHDLWSSPADLVSWTFVECGPELNAFYAESTSIAAVKKSLRRERRQLEKLAKLDQSGRTLREL